MDQTTVKQLSVFLENKSGRLGQVLEIISRAKVRVIAATVADTSEYGILRLITSDTQKAWQALKEENVGVNITDVIALAVEPQAGALARQVACFSSAGISIEYMYCFSVREKAFLILRTDNSEEAFRLISKEKLPALSDKELTEL